MKLPLCKYFCARMFVMMADYLAVDPDKTEKSVSHSSTDSRDLFSPSSLFSGNRISFLEEKTFRNQLVVLKYL